MQSFSSGPLNCAIRAIPKLSKIFAAHESVPPDPWQFRIFSKIRVIFAPLCLSPVSTTRVISCSPAINVSPVLLALMNSLNTLLLIHEKNFKLKISCQTPFNVALVSASYLLYYVLLGSGLHSLFVAARTIHPNCKGQVFFSNTLRIWQNFFLFENVFKPLRNHPALKKWFFCEKIRDKLKLLSPCNCIQWTLSSLLAHQYGDAIEIRPWPMCPGSLLLGFLSPVYSAPWTTCPCRHVSTPTIVRWTAAPRMVAHSRPLAVMLGPVYLNSLV